MVLGEAVANVFDGPVGNFEEVGPSQVLDTAMNFEEACPSQIVDIGMNVPATAEVF